MTQSPLRIAFAGTPDFAAQHLQALQENGCNIVAVFSQPDRPSGRGKKLKSSPVKALALQYEIPVYQPQSLNSSSEKSLLKSLNLDLIIVVAYGLILSNDILSIPQHGCLNVHASILPYWRGAAPIERAILNGDKQSGVSIMQMDEGLDTGDILLTLTCPILENDNSETLSNNLIKLGCKGLLTVLSSIATKTTSPMPQDGSLSTYASKILKHEALINWNNTAITLHHQINAFFPRSPAYCFINHQRVRVIHALPEPTIFSAPPGTIVGLSRDGLIVACQNSSLLITSMQFAGKKVTSIKDILNGQKQPFSLGDIFYSEDSQGES